MPKDVQSALIVGGTRFVGRHTVTELLAHDYDVTLLTRGNHENPFADHDRVDWIEGDRTERDALERAADAVDPDLVVDCVAYHPGEVREATEVFADVGAYVFVSSAAVYARPDVPKREGETPLLPCTDEQAADDSYETYGARKAEGDRAVFEAAGRGVNAVSVRPTVVYGPHDYTERLDYWIDRVRRFDRVVVPGDGQHLMHRVYVEDVASAIRLAGESGEPGAAYNVGDRFAATMDWTVELIARALDAEVEVVHASERELGTAELSTEDFPLYQPRPHLIATGRLADLGWTSTDSHAAVEATVADHVENDRGGPDEGPDRADEERVVEVLSTV